MEIMGVEWWKFIVLVAGLPITLAWWIAMLSKTPPSLVGDLLRFVFWTIVFTATVQTHLPEGVATGEAIFPGAISSLSYIVARRLLLTETPQEKE
jgi:hypothetical protein